MKKSPFTRIWRIAALTCFATLTLSLQLKPSILAAATSPESVVAAEDPTAEEAIQNAWETARGIGVYHFDTDVQQRVYPAPAVANLGRSSQTESYYLSGEVDQPAQRFSMILWQGAGSLDDPSEGVEIRIENGKAYGRTFSGVWQEMDDFTGLFAPGSDPLAYLAGAENIREVSNGDAGAGALVFNYTRYDFDINGPVFAAYLREQLEAELRKAGELPPGLTLDTSRTYQQMTGTGEIWLDSNGLPLRLVLEIAFPDPETGDRVQAEIKTDFSNFPDIPVSATGFIHEFPSQDWGLIFPQVAFWTLFAVSLAIFVTFRKSKKVYAAFVIAVISSMVGTPLLQSAQVAAFYDRLGEKQAEIDTTRAQQAAAQDLQRDVLTASWDPQKDPLTSSDNPLASNLELLSATASQSAVLGHPIMVSSLAEANGDPQPVDTDLDGVTDEIEVTLGLDPSNADSDLDGLMDGVELYRLGTNPQQEDSDGDGIYDKIEVDGYIDQDGRHWYLDPNAADTNKDGRTDTQECYTLVAFKTLGTKVCPDTDEDGTPDVFDRDDDGDGVPDTIDLYPDGMADRDGVYTHKETPQPFDGDHPFKLKVGSLEKDQPVFLDLQIRTQNPEHLTYALNVLDWPSSDIEGQIQHVKQTTLASGLTPDQLEANPSAANGDMRLIPMLEITMPEDSAVLARSNPATDIHFSGDISATIHLEAVNENADTAFNFAFEEDTLVYTVRLYAGGCPVSGIQLKTFTDVLDGQTRTLITQRTLDLADGDHALTVSDGTHLSCAPIENLINGPFEDEMIDPEPLTPYGISVREIDLNGTLAAYVPLNMVSDEAGGGRTAFQARMVYEVMGDATWDVAQQLRVVWLLQTLTDSCDPTGFEAHWIDLIIENPMVAAEPGSKDAQLQTWCSQPEHRTEDSLQIIHTYDDAWYLTGMRVREDHGLDMAIAYEDPVDGDLTYSSGLWQLAAGLGYTFLAAHDCADDNPENNPDYDPDGGVCRKDGYRDLGVYKKDQDNNKNSNTDIYNRFDRDGSVPDGDEARWGIPIETLQVERFRYDHEDYAAYMAMTVVPELLQENFLQEDKPTLLFAGEQHYRSTGLPGVVKSGQVFTVDMDPSGAPLETIASLKWMPYAYDVAQGWQPIPLDEYWDPLEILYTDFFKLLEPDASDEANQGRAIVARSFYYSLVQGMVQQTQGGEKIYAAYDPEGEDSDSFLTGLIEVGAIGAKLGKGMVKLVGRIVLDALDFYELRQILSGVTPVTGKLASLKAKLNLRFEDIRNGFLLNTTDPWRTMFSSGVKGKIGAVTMIAGAVAVLGLTIYGVSQGANPLEIVGIVLSGLSALAAIQMVAVQAQRVIQAAESAGSLSAAVSKGFADATVKTQAASNKGAIVGLIIGVVVAWAAFGVQVGLAYRLGSGMSSIALGTAIAGAIAATVIAVIMFVITLIPVIGPIIIAIIGLIDALVSLLCTTILTDEQEQHYAAQLFCGGLTGIVTKAIAALVYSGNVMVDLYPEEYDRLEFFNFEANDLVDPEGGIAEGNSVRYSLSITNTIDLIPLPVGLGSSGDYPFQYNDSQLRSSAFTYDLSYTNTLELHADLDRRTMSGDWVYVDEVEPTWGDFTHTWLGPEPVYITRTVASDPIEFLQAGINRTIPLSLVEGWAIPSQNCILGICTIWTERGTENFDIGSSVKFDIFPASLDAFYEMAAKGGGYALAWGGDGDATFPRLADADGDGLRYDADPHDNAWDSDGDGLSDSFEVQSSTNPNNADSDGDGLRDDHELVAGTNPLRIDSDGDGLLDGEEVFHQDTFDKDGDGNDTEWLGGWEFAYNLAPDGSPETTWVVPSPLNLDSDADSLTDFQEKTYGFNPNWISNSSVLTFESTVYEDDGSGTYIASDGFVQPDDVLYYEASVENELLNRWAHGLLDTDFPGEFNTEAVDPQPFLLYPNDKQVVSGEVPVADMAASGVYSLTQTAGALISDWTELASGAALWYPFEDAEDSVTFADRSGSIPPKDGVCSNSTGCAPIKNDGVYGGALNFNGTAYITSGYDPSDESFGISLWFKTTELNGGLFEIRDKDVYWLYMNAGKIHARIYDGLKFESILSTNTYNDDQWHHVVHTFGREVDGQKLYIDGLLIGSGDHFFVDISNNWSRIGYSELSGVEYYNGLIDDVRIYDKGLTYDEVQVLYNSPVLDLRFNESGGWVDSSPFNNNVSCSSANCPDHQDGKDGGAAGFSGSEFLNVGVDDSLDLSAGYFTIGAWIYPTTSPEYCTRREGYSTACMVYEPQSQGIFGYGSGDGNAYPSLQRVGNQLRFSFGAQDYIYTGDVLDPFNWNHIVITFDGTTLTIYRNGEIVLEDSNTFDGQLPPVRKRLTIGRSGTHAELSVKKVRVDDDGDPAQRYGELCMAFRYMSGGNYSDWVTVFDRDVEGGLVDANYLPLLYNPNDGGPFTISANGYLKMWEDDGGERCVTDENKWDTEDDPLVDDGDDEITGYKGGRFWQFDTEDVSRGINLLAGGGDPTQYYAREPYYGGSVGHFNFVYENDSIPFHGKIDEFLMYNRAFDQDDVQEMYQAHRTSLHLAFDDPPGQTSFEDSSFGKHNASCSGDACPVSGVSGRVNQAALFDGDDDVLNLGQTAINQLANSFSVAAWIKPDDLSGSHRILSSARTNSSNGFGFGTYGTDLRLTTWGKQTYDTVNLGLETGKWYHVAAVMTKDNEVEFYLNGEYQGVIGGGTFNPDPDDDLLVGATTRNGTAELIDRFDGRIDDLYVFSNALGAGAIQNLYRDAPLFQLHLDEAQGATWFEDDSDNHSDGSCSGQACPQTGFSIDGQIGTAAQFDGINDAISAPYNSSQVFDKTSTISAWVYPMGVKDTLQPLVVNVSNNDIPQFGLYIKPDSMTLQSRIWDCASQQLLDSEVPLVMNAWNHVASTIDRNTQEVTIYVNGAPQGSRATGSTWCYAYGPMQIGGGIPSIDHFYGLIDEVSLYDEVLSEEKIGAIFNYQGKWVQERQNHNITVDDDSPTVTLETTGERLPNADVQMLITASDPTSGIARVELGIRKSGESSFTWQEAPACGEAAWCPTFDPYGEGVYELRARIYDLVGHRTTTDQTVYVDNSKPVVTFDFADAELLQVEPSADLPNTWLLPLSGTVSDPNIGSAAGSGVSPDSLQVKLLDENGTLVGGSPQRAELSGGNWRLDYQIPEPEPSGWYTVTFQVADRIAEREGLSQNQIDRHTRVANQLIQIDATPPAAFLDLGGIPELISETLTLDGAVSEFPVPLIVEWSTDGHADELGLEIVCDSQTRNIFDSGTLQPITNTYTWRGEAHWGTACQLNLTDSAGDGGTNGRVVVCGEEVAAWDADFGSSLNLDFYADASTCGPVQNVSGVAGVQTALSSLLPGSVFLTKEPLPGDVLHMPLDEAYAGNGSITFLDISGGGSTGTCSGDTCPVPGQVGHTGTSVYFDGLDDKVQVTNNLFQLTTDERSIAFWVNPDSGGRGMLLGADGVFSIRRRYNGEISWRFNNTDPGDTWINTGINLPRGIWSHIVLIYDAGQISTYVDGLLVHTYSGSGSLPIQNSLYLGEMDGIFFKGKLDDVRLFDKAISDDDVKSIYQGVDPVLHLALDDGWMTGGMTVPDSSGWMNQGSLSTGVDDLLNKSVDGLVGPYALDFDGLDDAVSVSDHPSLDLETFSLGFWIEPAGWSRITRNPLVVKGNLDGSSLNYGLYITTGGDLAFRFHDQACSTRYNLLADGAGAPDIGVRSHYLVTYDGAQALIYKDGQQVASQAITGGVCQNDEPLRVGDTSSAETFEGVLDDIQIYPRPLSDLEALNLYARGWQAALTTPSGPSVPLGNWEMTPPLGLEGSFRLDLRGIDTSGLVSKPEDAWQGEVDTLAPRLTLESQALGTTVAFTTTAQDWNLTEAGYNTPCGAGIVSERIYYESPWYESLNSAQERLYSLETVCEVPISQVPGEVGAYDSPGLAYGIAISNSITYLADGQGGFHLIDVSDPIFPQVLSSFPALTPYAVAVAPGGPILQPDLVVESMTTDPADPGMGDTFVISVTVRNQGQGTAWDVYTSLYQDEVPQTCLPGPTSWIAHIPRLEPGAEATVGFFHLGFIDLDPHEFYTQVDPDCSILESDEGNNIFGPLDITAVQPDLLVQSISFDPASPTQNQAFSITVDIHNQGTMPSLAFSTTVYIDQAIGFTDCGVPGWQALGIASLDPGASDQLTFHHPGYASPGDHEVIAYVDSGCDVTEIEEGNNQRGEWVTIISTPQPDLLVNYITAETALPLIDQPLVITATVHNQGIAPSGAFTTTAFLDNAPSLCGDYYGVFDAVRVSNLVPGASTTLTFSNPGISTGGSHYVTARADSYCEVSESDEMNNTSYSFYLNVIDPNQPDLIVESILTDPPSPQVNQSFVVSLTVKNQGLSIAQNFYGYVTNAVYWDRVPSGCDESGAGTISWETDPIAPGASRVVTMTLPGFSTPGPHQLHGYADSGCSIPESNEANNILGPETVTVIVPDLVVEDLALTPPSPDLNQPFSLTLTVRNQGTGLAGAFDAGVFVDNGPLDGCQAFFGVYDTAPSTGLMAGAAQVFTFSHPGFNDPGQHVFYAEVDDGCAVSEADEGNNEYGPIILDIPSGYPMPDLLVTAISVEPSSPIQYDAPVTYTVTIWNQGTAAAGPLWTAISIDSPLSVCTQGGTETQGITSLDAGATTDLVYINWDGFATAGPHEIYAQVDEQCQIIDPDRANNIYATTVGVSAARGAFGAKTASLVPIAPPMPEYLIPSLDDAPNPVVKIMETAAPQAVGAYTQTYAYLADLSAGLRIIDVTDPAAPQEVSSLDLWGTVRDIAVMSDTAYVVAQFSGLFSVDVSNPGYPGQLDFLDVPGMAEGLALSETYAYVAAGTEGLHVIDVSDPTSLTLKTTYNTPGYAYGVSIFGDYAYVADGSSGLQVLDISNPLMPSFVGEFTSGLFVIEVILDNGLAYVATGSRGLAVLDVSDPANIGLERRFDTPGYAVDLVFSGTDLPLVYVADQDGGLRIVNTSENPFESSACDAAGNCTTLPLDLSPAELVALALEEDSTREISFLDAVPPLMVEISNLPGVLESTALITLTGYASATLTTLDAITVTADGNPLAVSGWISGTTYSDWQAAWTPTGEGQHRVEALVSGEDGSTASQVLTVTVDTQPPTLVISPTLYTGFDYYEPGSIHLRGEWTDLGGVSAVEFRTESGDWQLADFSTDSFVGATWWADWKLDPGPLPDNQDFTLYVRATDVAGHTTEVSQTVTVDVSPPAPVDLSLNNAGNPLMPGEILRTDSATLELTWPASSDNAGLDDYVVRWLTQVTATASATLTDVVSITGPLESSYAVADGERISVEMGSRDSLGNQRWSSFGSVYIDSQFTPDYVWMGDGVTGIYRGWMDSGCSLLGVDRRASRVYRGFLEQAFYASWDAQALRLSWTGANWNADGDLFIYLDTAPGGAVQAYNPNPATPAIQVALPEGMEADHLVWVQDPETASLLEWNGEWVVSRELTKEEHQFWQLSGNRDQITDLYLPYSDLGLDPGDSLGMLAFASDEDALRLWAAFPNANFVSSKRALGRLFSLNDAGDLSLQHAYHWDTLGTGICPNGSDDPLTPGFSDTEVQVSISADPPGASLNLLGDGLYWLKDLLLGSPPADVATQLDFLAGDKPVLGNGQMVTYTLSYQNWGSDTAYSVTAEIEPLYAMDLPGGTTVVLGDIGPGAHGEINFQGVVDIGLSSEDWAGVTLEIFDRDHPNTGAAIEWLWTHHRVDRDGPEFFGILQPIYLLGPGTNTLSGYAYDPSGVPVVEIQVQSPDGTQTLNCPNGDPMDGSWSCSLEISGEDGDLFTMTPRATDAFGLTSGLGAGATYVLDSTPPTLTLDLSVMGVTSGSLVSSSNLYIYGDAHDDGGLGRVDVCLDGDCGQADLLLVPGQVPVQVGDAPEVGLLINGGTTCGVGDIIRTFDITETFSIGDLYLGFSAEHTHRDDLQITLISPAGKAVQIFTDDGSSGTDFQGADFWFNDAAPLAFWEAGGDHNPGEPFFANFARPSQPMGAFLGEGSAGTWRLEVCDQNPGQGDGLYLRSELVLVPQDPHNKVGRWTRGVSLSTEDKMDYVTREISVYAQDLVGNRTLDPQILNLVVDNVSPGLTVTQLITTSPLGENPLVLTGLVTDGGPSTSLKVHVYPPEGGKPYNTRPSRDGESWSFELPLNYVGTYQLWVTASDMVGNNTTAGPFEVVAVPPSITYLPLVLVNAVFAPDLIVEELLITHEDVQIKVTNIGNSAVKDAFWVDLYINPDPVPTAVNQTWDTLAGQGLVWGVEDVSSLVPGGSITLNLSHPGYKPDYSNFSGTFEVQIPIYVQVDSFADANFGAILELDEIELVLYNNIYGPIYALPEGAEGITGTSDEGAVPASTLESDALPERPHEEVQP